MGNSSVVYQQICGPGFLSEESEDSHGGRATIDGHAEELSDDDEEDSEVILHIILPSAPTSTYKF